ncbi:DUF2971 domain-containing protein [Marinomonas arenicola]|uniref:DUF2971 domain-containing protein n=1 Tax=Marinomonas arenicola TaxID=569601 RepID=UPI00311E1C6B
MNLYKFQTINNLSLEGLIKHSLYFARTDQLNDPTEGMFALEGHSKDLKKFGILSMTKGEPSQIENSPFMWAHYGNELKGFCLVFGFDSFVSSIESAVLFNGDVHYQSGRTLLDPLSSDQGLEPLSGVDHEVLRDKNMYRNLFFQKPKEFENEREYRFITETSDSLQYDKKSLSKIIIGERMESCDETVLLSVLGNLGLLNKVEYAYVQKDSFKIQIGKFFL